MRESYRRDGAVTVFGDTDDSDELVVEPRIASFTPARGSLHCACGAELHARSLRPAIGGAELCCDRCHRVHGRAAHWPLTFGLRTNSDFYIEPEWCSERLFAVEQFTGAIWDPCCGIGRIVEAARRAGYPTIASDIVDRGYHEGH
jgi:hypothetical protein